MIVDIIIIATLDKLIEITPSLVVLYTEMVGLDVYGMADRNNFGCFILSSFDCQICGKVLMILYSTI